MIGHLESGARSCIHLDKNSALANAVQPLHHDFATTADAGLPESLRLHERLRKAGMRPTFHRLYVLRALARADPRAMTAEQVFQELCATDISVSQGTVYRVLSELEQHALLVKTRVHGAGDNKVRYAMKGTQSASPTCTFACPVCAAEVTVIDAAFNEQLQRQAQACGFDVQPATVQIAMPCRHCA